MGIARLLGIALCAVTAVRTCADTTRTGFDVRSFGARGDGRTDDTAAIRAAVDEAYTNQAPHIEVGRNRYSSYSAYDAPVREVFFPKGRYLVSDTITSVRAVVLRGEPGTEIRMTDASKHIFYFHRGYRCRVSGIKFYGGAMALRFWTQNHDTANLVVRDCEFHDTSAAAIECLSHANKARAPVPPYYSGEKTLFYNSTLMTVENCAFDNCRQALDVFGDGMLIRDCRITAPAVAGSVFRIGGRFHAYGLDVTVRRDENLRQSVFETYENGGQIDVCDSVFRTDTGKGICTFDSHLKPTSIGACVSLENLTVESGARPADSPLVIESGTSPNIVKIAGMKETGAKRETPIHFVGGRDGKTLADIRKWPRFSVERSYSCAVTKDAAPRLTMPSTPERKQGVVVQAVDCGVDLDPETDDTAAVRRAFAEAARHTNATIVFPGTWMKLSDTVDVPDGTVVTAEGLAGFRLAERAKDVFRATGFADVRFSNLHVAGGRHAVALRAAAAGKPAFARFDDCLFSDAASYAVQATVGDGTGDRRRDLTVILSGGVGYTAKMYRGNGTAWIDRFWHSMTPEGPGELKESVGYENRGVLVLRDLLGVPMTFDGMMEMSETPIVTAPKYTGDFRWVDNFGDFISLYVRYGGEWGGVTPVYSHGDGRVLLKGGFAWFENRMVQRYPVLADRPDACLRLSGMSFSPSLGEDVVFAWRDSKGVIRPTTGQDLTSYFPQNRASSARNVTRNAREWDL